MDRTAQTLCYYFCKKNKTEQIYIHLSVEYAQKRLCVPRGQVFFSELLDFAS